MEQVNVAVQFRRPTMSDVYEDHTALVVIPVYVTCRNDVGYLRSKDLVFYTQFISSRRTQTFLSAAFSVGRFHSLRFLTAASGPVTLLFKYQYFENSTA
jgi:hypothetical protein